MGRKLTDDELNDPDFQALLTALKKVAKPVDRSLARPSIPDRIPDLPVSSPTDSKQ